MEGLPIPEALKRFIGMEEDWRMAVRECQSLENANDDDGDDAVGDEDYESLEGDRPKFFSCPV